MDVSSFWKGSHHDNDKQAPEYARCACLVSSINKHPIQHISRGGYFSLTYLGGVHNCKAHLFASRPIHLYSVPKYLTPILNIHWSQRWLLEHLIIPSYLAAHLPLYLTAVSDGQNLTEIFYQRGINYTSSSTSNLFDSITSIVDPSHHTSAETKLPTTEAQTRPNSINSQDSRGTHNFPLEFADG